MIKNVKWLAPSLTASVLVLGGVVAGTTINTASASASTRCPAIWDPHNYELVTGVVTKSDFLWAANTAQTCKVGSVASGDQIHIHCLWENKAGQAWIYVTDYNDGQVGWLAWTSQRANGDPTVC